MSHAYHCIHDGSALFLVRDLTVTRDEDETALACPTCDRLYYVTLDKRTFRIVTAREPAQAHTSPS